jgi:hypothetical protein
MGLHGGGIAAHRRLLCETTKRRNLAAPMICRPADRRAIGWDE